MYDSAWKTGVVAPSCQLWEASTQNCWHRTSTIRIAECVIYQTFIQKQKANRKVSSSLFWRRSRLLGAPDGAFRGVCHTRKATVFLFFTGLPVHFSPTVSRASPVRCRQSCVPHQPPALLRAPVWRHKRHVAPGLWSGYNESNH